MHLECHHNTTNLTLFCFKCAAFYQLLKSKVRLTPAKVAALRINLNVEGRGIVAAPVHAPSRTSLLLSCNGNPLAHKGQDTEGGSCDSCSVPNSCLRCVCRG